MKNQPPLPVGYALNNIHHGQICYDTNEPIHQTPIHQTPIHQTPHTPDTHTCQQCQAKFSRSDFPQNHVKRTERSEGSNMIQLLINQSNMCCCCCMPSETYGRNGVTLIFRSFRQFHHRRLESLAHFNVFIYIYIVLSTTVSF